MGELKEIIINQEAAKQGITLSDEAEHMGRMDAVFIDSDYEKNREAKKQWILLQKSVFLKMI